MIRRPYRGDKVYTRKGAISEEQKPIKTYRVPIASGDEIRINIPYNATKLDLQQTMEHLQVISKYWDGEGEYI